MRKKQRSENGIEVETEDNDFVLEPTQIEAGSGYTLTVRYDEDQRPTVAVKTYGQVDIIQVKREILRIFPDAQVRHTNQTESVKIVKASEGKSKKQLLSQRPEFWFTRRDQKRNETSPI